MRDSVKFDPSIPDRQVTGESSVSQYTCSSASQSEYLDVQSFSSASSYMALPSLKHGKRHIPLSALGPPGPSSRRTGCSNSNCNCEEESIMQNMCNKRNERLNKPCKDGFCYCFTSDSEDFRKHPSTSVEHHRCKALRKEYAYNLPTESDCSEVVSSDQYFADKEKERKKKRMSLPVDVIDSATVPQNGSAGCAHKDEKCTNDKCRHRPFKATNKFKEFHCSDSDAPLIHIIQEVQRNTVVSEIRINRSKLKKSKVRSKSAGRAGEDVGSARVTTSDKIINTEYNGINGQPLLNKSTYRPEGKDAGTNTNLPVGFLHNSTQTKKSAKNFLPSEDDDSRSDLSSAKPKSNKSKGGKLLQKRIGSDVVYRPSIGPPRKPPRNLSSSSDCSSLASEPMKPNKHVKKKNRLANTSIGSIGEQPTLPVNFPLIQDTDGSGNGKDHFKKGSINSLNSVVSKKPEVVKDTFDKLSGKADATADRTSICSSEGGYSQPVAERLNIQNDSVGSGLSSRQEFTPTCPPYSEVASPEASNINDLLRMLPNVPTGPIIFNEPLNKLNIEHLPHPVEFAEINVIPESEIPNPEQVGWVPPAVYNMLNTDADTQKFVSQNPLAGPQQGGWQPPQKLQIDTVDGSQPSENENSHNLASNMELKSTPVKPDIPKDELTPKNIIREKMKNLPQPPSKPARQVAAGKMPTLLEMSHSGDEKTILTFGEILANAKEPATATDNAPKPALNQQGSSSTKEETFHSGPVTQTLKPKELVDKIKEQSIAIKQPSVGTKEPSVAIKDSSKGSKEPSSILKGSSMKNKDATAKDQTAAKETGTLTKDSVTTPKESGKSFQKRALKHTKSFLESLGFSKKKDGRKGANKEVEEPPKAAVETVGTQTNDAVVLQGRRLKFDYASDDTMERRSITPIGGENESSVAKPTHHSDDGFDFSRTVLSPKPERSSQRKNFTPKNFLKTLQPGGEKPAQDESYRSYASDLSEDLTVAVQDLLGKAKAKLEGESVTTVPETVTNTLTDESVAACTISALADVHPEPIYAEIREEDVPRHVDLIAHPTSTSTLVGSDDKVIYAKVEKKSGDKQPSTPLSPHRPAPRPPKSKTENKSNALTSDLSDHRSSVALKESDQQQPAQVSLGRNKEEVPTSVASGRSIVSPQPTIQSNEGKNSKAAQDNKANARPKQSPPPVPIETTKVPLERHVRFPTPPQQSPLSSRPSSSASSSRGAFSPHLDDFFAHGPLQEVDTGPFVEQRPNIPENSSDSSTGRKLGYVVASTVPADKPGPSNQQNASRRSKRHVIYENLPSDVTRQANLAEPIHQHSSNTQEHLVPEPSAPPPRPPRIDIRQEEPPQDNRPSGLSPAETRPINTSSNRNEEQYGIHSPGHYYPPLPNLRTTPRSSPQGQSSPDQDNYPEVYGSVQPGELSTAGTQSFFSAQSDRYATPVGRHQSQPPIVTRQTHSSGQAQATGPEGWHQRQPVSNNENNSNFRGPVLASGASTSKGQPLLPVEHDGNRRHQPQGSSHSTAQSQLVSERQPEPIYSNLPVQQTQRIYPHVSLRDGSNPEESESYQRQGPTSDNTIERQLPAQQIQRVYPNVPRIDGSAPKESDSYRKQGHKSNSVTERQAPQRPPPPEFKKPSQSLSHRNQHQQPVRPKFQETQRNQGIYPIISRVEPTSLSEGEKDRRLRGYVANTTTTADPHEELPPELPRRRRRSTDDAMLANQSARHAALQHDQSFANLRANLADRPEVHSRQNFDDFSVNQHARPSSMHRDHSNLRSNLADRRVETSRRTTDDFSNNQRDRPAAIQHNQPSSNIRDDLGDRRREVQTQKSNMGKDVVIKHLPQAAQKQTEAEEQQVFDYNTLPSPPHNISMGNPPVIEYAFPPKQQSNSNEHQEMTSSHSAAPYIPVHSIDVERPLQSSTPEPAIAAEPIPSTSFNNSLERNRAPKHRVLSKSDLSQASDIFLENLNQKNVNVTRYSDRSDRSDYTDRSDQREHRAHSSQTHPLNMSDRSDEEKKSNSDSPVAISQFYYYDSSNGNGESSNSSFCRDARQNRKQGSDDEDDFKDPCCGENCQHLKPGGYDTVDFENESPETISYKSCRSNEEKDENMNNSASKDLNEVEEVKPGGSKYEILKHKLRASIRKGKNYFKRKELMDLDRNTKSDNDSHARKQIALKDRKGESDFEVDYISAIEMLNESSKDASLKRQLEQTVSLCRKFPEFETSPEMVEAERLLLYTSLKEKSSCRSNDSVSSYRSTPKDFINGRICVTSFEIPIKPNIHHDTYFNYFYIGVFSQGQDIRSTQSAEKADEAVFFSDCNMLFNDLSADFEINVDLYVLRLRKLSSPPIQQDNTPVTIRKSSLSDSQEEVVSRFRMHGNFIIHATDLAPFEVKTDEDNFPNNSEFHLVSNNIFTLPINLYPRNINLSNEVWLTANAAYRFKNFHLNGFLNVGEGNGKLNWNKRWCQIDALSLYFWNYPQDCSESPPILTLDLTYCVSNPIKNANREICPKPRSFQLEMHKYTSVQDESEDDSVEVLLFSTESQDDYSYWVKGLNYVLDFIRAWKVQVQ